jgi:hypothetical protein
MQGKQAIQVLFEHFLHLTCELMAVPLIQDLNRVSMSDADWMKVVLQEGQFRNLR